MRIILVKIQAGWIGAQGVGSGSHLLLLGFSCFAISYFMRFERRLPFWRP
jgi:hypothetical protein